MGLSLLLLISGIHRAAAVGMQHLPRHVRCVVACQKDIAGGNLIRLSGASHGGVLAEFCHSLSAEGFITNIPYQYPLRIIGSVGPPLHLFAGYISRPHVHQGKDGHVCAFAWLCKYAKMPCEGKGKPFGSPIWISSGRRDRWRGRNRHSVDPTFFPASFALRGLVR